MRKSALLLMALLLLLTGCGTPAAPAASLPPAAEAEPEVRVQWAKDAPDVPADTFTIKSGSESVELLFTAPGGVTDFRLLGLTVKDAPGGVSFNTAEIYARETLGPERGLIVRLVFYGDTPSFGFSYADAAGATRRFTVEISGMDGSLLLTEF